MIVDGYRNLISSLGSGRLLPSPLGCRNGLSKIDDLQTADWPWAQFDQIQAETLGFAQSVRKFHDAELFAGGCEDDPDFSGANPTVYTNLWLQIKSKLLAGEAGSEPPRRIYSPHFSGHRR